MQVWLMHDGLSGVSAGLCMASRGPWMVVRAISPVATHLAANGYCICL